MDINEKNQKNKAGVNRWLKQKRQNKKRYYQNLNKNIPSDIPIFIYLGC